MNTRLQVEHPVTEAITGLDLVELQGHVAQGEPLPFDASALRLDGHAFEARLYAEDPAADFLPATGRVVIWEPAPLLGVRYDSGVEAGSEVSVHYDPLLAKIIAHGATRDEARRRLIEALQRLGVAGVTTNREFLIALLSHPEFAAGAIDTHFIERHSPPIGGRCNAIRRSIARTPSSPRWTATRAGAVRAVRCRRAFRRAGATTAGGRRT